ncbi:MAG: hypothetical protein ACI4SF_14710 [Oscillospiraceae bacterium]
MQKCPICGGTVGNGVCISCGYEIPDENTIAAPYNYDPDDYAQQENVHEPEEIEEIAAVSSVQNGSDGKNGTPDWAEMDAIGIPSSETVSQAFVKKPPLEKPAPENRTEVKNTPPPSVYTQFEPPQEEPQDALSIFVNGFVYEVKRHWWKVLLILLVPVAAIFMGTFYLCMSGGFRRHRFRSVDPERFDFKAFGLGILYMAIGFGLILSDWDPFGLSAWIMSLF